MSIDQFGKIKNLQILVSELKEIIDEKNKEIISLKEQLDMAHNFNQNLGKEIIELKSKQLFKEDFRQSGGIYYDGKFTPIYNLIDNSKWEKLNSKDDKNVS